MENSRFKRNEKTASRGGLWSSEYWQGMQCCTWTGWIELGTEVETGSSSDGRKKVQWRFILMVELTETYEETLVLGI